MCSERVQGQGSVHFASDVPGFGAESELITIFGHYLHGARLVKFVSSFPPVEKMLTAITNHPHVGDTLH